MTEPAETDVSNTTGRTSDSDELDLFRTYARTRQRALRNELVERYMGLAIHIAKRYWRTGSEDDVRQSAMIGLIKAVDRFDPELGVSFVTFAGSTIEGELKRYLRDRTWVLRVPRSAKELHLHVRRASDELLQRHGRSPSVAEVAAFLQVPADDVLRGLTATAAYEVGSIDGSRDSDVTGNDRSRALAAPDRSIDDVVDAHVVARLLSRLPEREREIVRLHFFEEQSQAQVGELMGISQMHVSRLLRRSFETMRGWMNESPSDD
jgi:RNA polymerase sigma-B factor